VSRYCYPLQTETISEVRRIINVVREKYTIIPEQQIMVSKTIFEPPIDCSKAYFGLHMEQETSYDRLVHLVGL
jgi:hypothetical protein